VYGEAGIPHTQHGSLSLEVNHQQVAQFTIEDLPCFVEPTAGTFCGLMSLDTPLIFADFSNPLELGLSLSQPWHSPEPRHLTLARFGSNFYIAGIRLFNDSGAFLGSVDYTSDSGAAYPVGVPEPRSLSLLITAMLLAAYRLARRSRVAAR